MPSTLWTTILQFHTHPDRVMAFLVHRYRQPVVEFSLVQGLSAEDAEDVAQEVFIRVCSDRFLKKVDQIRTRFRNVLLAVTKRVIISQRRHQTARIRDRRRDVALEGDIPTASPPDPEFDRLWVKNLVEQAMESLDADVAMQALRLHLKGLSYQQVAEALGKKATDVTNLLHRARVRLRREIERLIAEYSPREDIDEEIAALRRFL